jgi:hypothetical protein
VTPYIDTDDGSLTVHVVATAAVSQCPFGEYPLFVRFSLRSIEKASPTSQPSISVQPSNFPTSTYSPTTSHVPTMTLQPTVIVASHSTSRNSVMGLNDVSIIILLCAMCVSPFIVYEAFKMFKSRQPRFNKHHYKLKAMKLRESPKKKNDISARRVVKTRESKSSKRVKGANRKVEGRSRNDVMDLDMEEGDAAFEHTPLKGTGNHHREEEDSDLSPLAQYLNTTVSPIKHAWAAPAEEEEEEQGCTNDRRSGGTFYDEKGDSSDEDDSFDYDEDSLNIQVRLRFGESVSRLKDSVISGARYESTEEFNCAGISNSDDEPFMGHKL